jgi:pilus assembly protein CpaB
VSRRARALALLGVAAICAGLSASIVNGYAADVRAQVGPLVPVLVSRTDIPAGKVLGPQLMRSGLGQKQVPERYAPPDALSLPGQAAGKRTLIAIPTGSYIGRSQLERTLGPDAGGGSEARQVEVPVAGTRAMRDRLQPGAQVDVLVTSDGEGSGSPRTYLALQGVELIELRPDEGANEGGEGPRADAAATLRVSLRQAVLLTAAGNFARELRLVPRPAGDRRRLRATAVTARDLHP